MGETVTIPKVEYDRLRALEEDLADRRAARCHRYIALPLPAG